MREAVDLGHEVSCHGWRWQRHAGMAEDEERAVIARTYATVAEACGVPPVGWHTRSSASVNTRRLLVEHGGSSYDSDAYDDDAPYTVDVSGHRHLVLPYAFDTNDMRFRPGGAFVHGEDFARYVIAAFEWLAREGKAAPRMMSTDLHLRTIGRPARISGLERVIEALGGGGAWFAPRADIARHWARGNEGRVRRLDARPLDRERGAARHDGGMP